ncbi:MAG: GNAT family N-acetyltransferase [Clostridia bacterium]|nr:GNAT family N-acetyltransferase [Clostridia bacterium]
METERLILRAFRPEDADDLYACLSREPVVRYEPYEPFTRQQAAEEAARRAGDPAFIAVVLKEIGRVIGNVWFAPGEWDAWELGYVFHDACWGRGYAAEACRAVLEDGFVHRGVRRVVAMCNPENAASWRLLERLGFIREGHLRRNVFFRRDESGAPCWQDTFVYGLLREDRPGQGFMD